MYACTVDSSTYSNSDNQQQQQKGCKNNIPSEISRKFTNIYKEKASNTLN